MVGNAVFLLPLGMNQLYHTDAQNKGSCGILSRMPDLPNGVEAPAELEQTPEPMELPEITPAEADEAAIEALPETRDDILHAEEVTELEAAQGSSTTPQTQTPSDKDETVIEVEHVLEEGLGPFFESLPPDARPVFKQKGEEVATELARMVSSMHVNVRRALRLIADWLKTIPGVNRFFLEQEAKIKTDRIVALTEERKNDQHS